MIPVQPQPEPQDFDMLVRGPGAAFLARVPHPIGKQWDGREYWRGALHHMRTAYRGVCAYCAHWIAPDTGSHTIDHFLPKSSRPDLAYEWSNFRYASLKLNGRKGEQLILDPFQLVLGWFFLDFPSLLVKPNSSLGPDERQAVSHTIDVLKLNEDDSCVEARQGWVLAFCSGEISFAHLSTRAPFIACELQRQKLVEKIAIVMSRT